MQPHGTRSIHLAHAASSGSSTISYGPRRVPELMVMGGPAAVIT
jgi:hypothetical protein